jgi:hypothetical protein
MADLTTLLSKFLEQLYAGNVQASGDGTSLLPAYSFASEPTLGFYRSSSGIVTLAGGAFAAATSINAGTSVSAAATSFFTWGGTRNRLLAPIDGQMTMVNVATTIGALYKFDALPTLSSGGGGTAPAAVTAGSTPLAGSVNVGTGVITSPIVINFNGTAFPSAPFVVCNDGQTAIAVRATATTTQLTLTSAAFVASDVISWICISSK